jgi:hypothetical protein
LETGKVGHLTVFADIGWFGRSFGVGLQRVSEVQIDKEGVGAADGT